MNFLMFLMSFVYFLTTVQEVNSHSTIDYELHERVLDPEQCKKQLHYIWRRNPLLLTQFVEAGLRVPRGISSGNFRDFGLYEQCLAIRHVEDDMTIEGKYCVIGVPPNQNVNPDDDDDDPEYMKWNFNPNMLKLNYTILNKLEKNIRHKKIDNAIGASAMYGRTFRLAMCVPKVCTTNEALSVLRALGFQHYDYMCRLPNDRPWVTADYVAIGVFSTLALVTLLSTGYDIHHTSIRKKDPKDANVILTAFSAHRNCRQLLSVKTSPKAVYCLDGIRALSTFWVIIGHLGVYYEQVVVNLIDINDWFFSYQSIWIITGPLAVDTFFLLSGVLLIYTTAGKVRSTRQLLKNLPLLFLLRLLRLFPVLAAIVLFEASFLNRLGDGPNWGNLIGPVLNCRKNWWTTLLHVQNYVTPREQCGNATWYLGIDTSLHLISLLSFVIVLGKGKKVALAGLVVIFLTSITASSIYIFTNENIEDDFYINYYYNILTRAPPFFIGLIFGYIMHLVREKKLKMPVIPSILITSCSLALVGLAINYFFELETGRIYDKTTRNALHTFLRSLWSLGLGWIIFACASGHGGPIDWFLSLNIWRIPARISYAMYLYHMFFMIAVYANMQSLIVYSMKSFMFHFMSFFAISLIVGFFLTALIDSPFAIIFKALFEKIGPKPQPRSKESSNEIKSNED